MRQYTLKKDLPDNRDYKIESLFMRAMRLPRKYIIENPFEPFNQEYGDCTANAGCAVRSLLWDYKHNQINHYSRMFLYYNERKLEGTLNEQDPGSTMRSICKALNKYGVCKEETYPYEIGIDGIPALNQYNEGLNYTISGYHSVSSFISVKTAIANNMPVLLGMDCYEEFESVGKTGILKYPTKNSEYLGGHAVFAYGYDGNNLIVRNSWGCDWGKNGDFMMSKKYYEGTVNGQKLCYDNWVITVAK